MRAMTALSADKGGYAGCCWMNISRAPGAMECPSNAEALSASTKVLLILKRDVLLMTGWTNTGLSTL